MAEPVTVFCAAAPQDSALLVLWERHLLPLQENGLIVIWSEAYLLAGKAHDEQVVKYLEQARIIVLLLSADFLVHHKCRTLIEQALQYSLKGQASVVPLLLRSCAWEMTGLSHLASLPSDKRPVMNWSRRDDAWQNCVDGLTRVLAEFTSAASTNLVGQSHDPVPPELTLTPAHPEQSDDAQKWAGQPDDKPALAVSHVPRNQLVAYHSCVLSYASADVDFVRKLYADLQARGVVCWFAEHDLKQGDRVRAEIYQAIFRQRKLLLVLSQHAIESLWVEEEVEVALDREHQQQGTSLLFPLRLDDTIFRTDKYWGLSVRQRYIGDFRHWQEDNAYQNALLRLLRDLRA
ncbi:MAG TPA: toll/interleukin-1 receptor domain-containing protein [Ktedonobacteraceae bacterium]